MSQALKGFIANIKDVEIIVVEQLGNKKFNRGKLLNIGFKESNEPDFVITHDVDLIPSNKLIKEKYTLTNFDALRIYSAHEKSLGGIVKLSKNSFIKANGFPNNIWGWGIEDRALYYRYSILDLNISTNKFDDNLSEIYCIPHRKVWETYVGEKKEISDLENTIFNESKKTDQLLHIQKSGLNNLSYKVLGSNKINEITKIISVSL